VTRVTVDILGVYNKIVTYSILPRIDTVNLCGSCVLLFFSYTLKTGHLQTISTRHKHRIYYCLKLVFEVFEWLSQSLPRNSVLNFFPFGVTAPILATKLSVSFRFTSSEIFGMTPWAGDQFVTRPLPVHKHSKTHICMHTNITHLCLVWDSNLRSRFQAKEDSACLRPRGYRERQSLKLGTSFSIHPEFDIIYCGLLTVLLNVLYINK
jgi:hypothetical protein